MPKRKKPSPTGSTTTDWIRPPPRRWPKPP
jgi:hypothetical protein